MRAHSELSAPGFVVIVLDDDLAVRNSLKFSLEIEGFTVRSYASGAELLGAGGSHGLRLSCGRPAYARNERARPDRHAAQPTFLGAGHPDYRRPQSVCARARRKASVPIVEKPLLGNALLQKIRDMAGDGRS